MATIKQWAVWGINIKTVVSCKQNIAEKARNYSRPRYFLHSQVIKEANQFLSPDSIDSLLEFLKKNTIDFFSSIVLISITGKMLQSGSYHIYRGVLDNQGKELKSIFCKANKDLYNKGLIDQETYDQNMEEIRVAIAESG